MQAPAITRVAQLEVLAVFTQIVHVTNTYNSVVIHEALSVVPAYTGLESLTHSYRR